MAERVEVVRQTVFKRIIHWVIFILLIILIITGLEIGGIYGSLPIFVNVRALHIWVGAIWMALILVYLYYIIVIGEAKFWIPNLWGIRYLIAEAKAWLGIGPRPEEPVVYDAKAKKYIRRVDPGAWIDFWVFAIITILMGITGVSMAFLTPWFYAHYALIRAFHRFLMYCFIAMAILHAYSMFVLGYLKSMVTGKRMEPILKESEQRKS